MAAGKAILWVGGIASAVYLYKAWVESQGEDGELPGQGGGFGGAGEYAGNPYDTDGDGIPNESDPTPNGPSGGSDGYPDADGDGIPDINDYHFGEGAYPPEAGTTDDLGDPRTTDTDGDGTPDQWDYTYGEGDGTDQGSYPEPGFLDTGLGFIVGTTAAGVAVSGTGLAARAAYTKLRSPSTKGLIEFAPETKTLRSLESTIELRKTTGKTFKVLDAGSEAASIAARTESGAARLIRTTGLTPKAIAVAGQAERLSLSTVRAASAASKPGTIATAAKAVVQGDLASGAARFAEATARFTTRAAPVARTAGRVAGAADIAYGVYTAGRNLGETAAAAQVLFDGRPNTQAEIDRARELSARSVARGTEFLSLGVAEFDPRGEVRIFNRTFEQVDAPNSFREAGSNLRRNLGTIGSNLKKNTKTGGRDGNKWTPW